MLANIARTAYRERLSYGRFLAEGASHLRYTRLVTEGTMPPALDREAQYPEGLRVYGETSIGMEFLYGLVYRAIPGKGPDLSSFIRVFTVLLFSLAVFPLAALSEKVWGSRKAALFSALIFAIALPLVGRSSGFEYIRENLALPLLVYHIFFLVSASTDGGWKRPLLSSLFLFLALSTWQGTQFYVASLMFFILARSIAGTTGGGERRAAWAVIVTIAAAGAIVPFLREGGFLLSIPASFAAAWLIIDLVFGRPAAGTGTVEAAKRRAAVRLLTAAAAVSGFIAAAALLRGNSSSYSHFFNLLIYKLRYLQKPTDPSLLPFDVRAFWVGPFHSPDLLHLFVFALPVLFLMPRPVARLASRSRAGEYGPLFILCFLGFFFLIFLLMQRMIPFFGIFAAVSAGGIVPHAETGGRRWKNRFPLVLAGAVAVVMLLQDFFWEGKGDIWRSMARSLHLPQRERFVIYPYRGDVDGPLFSWIERNTPPEAVVMTFHYLSPAILTYTGRPTNLNDFFEADRLRRKSQRFIEALYSGEEEMFEFCLEQSSDYLLVSVSAGCDPSSDSPLYQAGLSVMPDDCAAYRMIFAPERLERFNLQYENEMYRLFRVGEPYEERDWPRSPLFYERELLDRVGGDRRAFYNTVMHVYAVTVRGRILIGSGLTGEGEKMLVKALRVFYFYPAWYALDRLYEESGRREERLSLARFAEKSDPNRAAVCLSLADAELALGLTSGVGALLERCADLKMTSFQSGELRRLESELKRITDR